MKFFKYNLLLILGLMFFAAPFLARAATSVQPRGFAYSPNPQMTLNYLGQHVTVDPNEILLWQTPLQLNNASSLKPDFDLAPKLSNFFGVAQNLKPSQSKWYDFRVDRIYSYLLGLESKINQNTSEPKFEISGNKVTDFSPGQNGQKLLSLDSAYLIAQALENGETDADINVVQTTPQKQLSDINPYGIKELVAEGVSDFRGSPQNRRHNITVGTEKMKGILLPKGATFSFNDNLGPVDAEHGFLPELVIKKEGTVPEFGGGLCQVSSTAFRAAMNAGLPIVERRNHAYAVQYYSPQGTDATIYPGVVDLKFTNNTPGYILIWPYQKDQNTLVFDFYGTKDGREVTLDHPDVYDKKPDGSMKATWTRHITQNGETKTDVFKSVYQSPALFHHEESFSLNGQTFYVGQSPKKTN